MSENKYQYRNLPRTNYNWYIAGTDNLKTSGILEWCISEKDAHDLISHMRNFSQFYHLRIEQIDNGPGIPCSCYECYENIKQSHAITYEKHKIMAAMKPLRRYGYP